MRSVKWIRAAKVGSITLSAVMGALGLWMILRPDTSVRFAGIALGVLMIAFGAVKLVGYFSKDLYRLAFQFDLGFGMLLIALGAVFALRPGIAVSGLCGLMGLELIADGMFKVQMALDARRFGIGRWWLIFAVAVAAAAMGVLLVIHPFQAGRALMALLGTALVAESLLNLCVMLCAVKIIRHQRPDGLDAKWAEGSL